MKALLVGNGAREHAIAEQIVKSSRLYVFAKARNPGIAGLACEYKIGNINDRLAVLEYAQEVQPEYVFIGPEAPLGNGVSDTLEEAGIPVAGPSKSAARLETDKAFCRGLMQKYMGKGIPKFRVCHTPEEVLDAIKVFETDIVVKPAGLTGGKGVKVVGQQLKNLAEARDYALEVVNEKIGGSASVVLEEKLVGEEFTLQVFTDGETIAPMPLVQDHKHAYEGDTGPMTGGMGSYSDANHLLPFLKQGDVDAALKIIEKTVKALKEETGEIYKGVLYGQFMLTKNGPKVIEYNVRFGDPEAMNVLPLLKTDFSEVCIGITEGLLSSDIEFEDRASVCKYLVPKGYPTKPESGAKVSINENAITSKGAKLYYASVDQREDGIYTSASRSFGITGISDTLEEAERISEGAINTVECEKLFYRPDIGKPEVIQKRISHMKEVRGK